MPVLDLWRNQTLSCVGAVPDAFRHARMPRKGGQSVCRVSEHRLPFPEAMFDRMILLHALEEAENPRLILREVWRVLAPEGRLVVIAANRKSLWSLDESKPFGHGRPWTRRQLSTYLTDSLFDVSASTTAIHMPPLNWPLITAAAHAWESAGQTLMPGLGGVVMIEAVKHLHARPGAQAMAHSAVKSGKVRPALSRDAACQEKSPDAD